MNSKRSMNIILLSGIIMIIITALLQVFLDIINSHIRILIVVYYVYMIALYKYIKKNVVEINENCKRNKTLLNYGIIEGIIIFLGILASVKNMDNNQMLIVAILVGMFVYHLIAVSSFYISPSGNMFKYVMLTEFIVGYAGAVVLASYWIFFLPIPILMVCTIYGNVKFTAISGFILTLLTVIFAISEIKVTAVEKDSVYYYTWLYITVIVIYIIIFITVVATSYTVKKINKSRFKEVVKEQNNVIEISETVFDMGKNIIEEARNTKKIVDDIENITDNMLEISDDILVGNEESVYSASLQYSKASDVGDKLTEVKRQIDNTKHLTRISNDKIVECKEMMKYLQEKSVVITNNNENVIYVIEEFIRNIAAIRECILYIEDIVEQTDSLSLNAAVESKRSINEDKDFAVVAGEIKNLADSSVDLLGDINRTIDKIDNNICEVYSVMNEGIRAFNEENKALKNTVGKFNVFDDYIRGLDMNINRIIERIESVFAANDLIYKQSRKLVDFSNTTKEKTIKTVEHNKNNKKKAEQTRETMDKLIGIVNELNEYV